jgi:hypothetical protein
MLQYLKKATRLIIISSSVMLISDTSHFQSAVALGRGEGRGEGGGGEGGGLPKNEG